VVGYTSGLQFSLPSGGISSKDGHVSTQWLSGFSILGGLPDLLSDITDQKHLLRK